MSLRSILVLTSMSPVLHHPLPQRSNASSFSSTISRLLPDLSPTLGAKKHRPIISAETAGVAEQESKVLSSKPSQDFRSIQPATRQAAVPHITNQSVPAPSRQSENESPPQLVESADLALSPMSADSPMEQKSRGFEPDFGTEDDLSLIHI